METVKAKGFAVMDPLRVKEIASLGGKAAHKKGVAHQWSPTEARIAGAKGGLATAQRRTSDRTGT